MKKVFKYQFVANDYVTFGLPIGAEILTVQEQKGNLCLWALVDPNEHWIENRVIRMAGTGHPIDDVAQYRYINTIQLLGGELIFHFFEVVE